MESYSVEAELQAALGQFSNAFEAYESALSYLRSHPPNVVAEYEDAHPDWASGLYQQQGYLHYLLGNLSSSIQHYLRAFEHETTSRGQIEQLLNVGILHQRTQDYRSARHYYQRAQTRLQREDLAQDDREEIQARTYQVRADLLLEQTLNTEFDPAALEDARDFARRGRSLSTPGTERHARLSLFLSESLGYLGNFEEAYPLNEEVREYARTNDDFRLQTFALLKLGVLHVQTEHWPRADSVLNEALGMAETLGDRDYKRRILRALGRLYEMQDQWTEAEEIYRRGVAVIEEYRESLTSSQWSMTAFAQWRDVHRGLVRSLLAQDKPREAFTALDRSRARHLQDLRTQARVSNQLPSEERARLDSLSRALTDVRNQLAEASLPTDQEAELRNREASLMAARQQLLQIDSDASRPSLDSITTTLSEQDRALVSYFLDDPWPVYDRAPHSTAFVLTADTLRTISLPALSQDSVQAQVEQVSSLFTSRGKPDRMNAMHFDLRPLRTLHEAVYAPIREHLPPNQPLTVVPDGPLFHLPFSMLVEALPGGRFAPDEARYMLHERATSLELASSLVADDGPTYDWSQFEPQLAAYGVSDFDTLETIPSALRTALPDVAQDSSIRLPPLPGVQKEIDALTSSISNARMAVNGDATEQSFCRDARRAGILHVASHAFVNASSPLQNAILLRTDSTAQSSSDGVLFLHELQSQQSQIPLVVLSGCSTARGSLRGGEGMEGLQYAFRAMGAQSTVSTLWPVDDDASSELMARFYDHLNDGLSKDRALRQAQLDYLSAHPEKASPFFWAPPVLYGSPAALPISSSSFPAWGWGVVLAVFLLLGLLLWWQRERLLAPLSGNPHQ
jgi:CHAT domain-containing protein